MEKTTKGVRTLLGDPRKAILKLSLPMIIAMLVQSLYNIIDGVWVSGLGAKQLGAIGLFYPVFMVIISLATGIGIGGSSSISRKIGARDKEKASIAAVTTIIIGLGIGLSLTLIVLPFVKQVFRSMGTDEETLRYVIPYAKILICGAVILTFSNVATGILRGEGDTRRAMYAMIAGSVLNILLDPIFIYKLKLGVAGAAWATLISITVTSLLTGYWLLIKKDTYVRIKFRGFRFNGRLTMEILRVGIPASISQLSMSIAMFALNMIVVKAGGTNGVAVFTSAWRIVMLGIIPLLGISTGVIAVTGAAYGAKDINRLKTGYFYGIKIGVIIELFVVTLMVIFARQISFIFTYSKTDSVIRDDLITALRILPLFLFLTPFGMFTSSMFQGIGFGERALAMSILRTIILQVFFGYLFGIVLHKGLIGVWFGIITGNVTSSFVGITWGILTINGLRNRFMPQQGNSQ